MAGNFDAVQSLEHAMASAVVDVQCPLARHASEVRETKSPAVFLAVIRRLESEELFQPDFDDLRMDDEIHRTVEKRPRTYSGERPETVCGYRRLRDLPKHGSAERFFRFHVKPF